jgi:hypothetical protein
MVLYTDKVTQLIWGIDPMYHLLAFRPGNSRVMSSHRKWQELKAEERMGPVELGRYVTSLNCDRYHQIWGLTILLAPRLDWVRDWWWQDLSTKSYALSHELPSLRSLPEETYAFLKVLLAANSRLAEPLRTAPFLRVIYEGYAREVDELAHRFQNESRGIQGTPQLTPHQMLKHNAHLLIGGL